MGSNQKEIQMNIANRVRQFLEQPGLEQEEIDEEVFFRVDVTISTKETSMANKQRVSGIDGEDAATRR